MKKIKFIFQYLYIFILPLLFLFLNIQFNYSLVDSIKIESISFKNDLFINGVSPFIKLFEILGKPFNLNVNSPILQCLIVYFSLCFIHLILYNIVFVLFNWLTTFFRKEK